MASSTKTNEARGEEVRTPGARIRAAREKGGWSRRQVADVLGISYQRVADIEADRKRLTLENILRLAEAIGADPHAIDERLAPRKVTRRP